MADGNTTSIDPTQPIPVIEAEKQGKISKAKPMSWKPGQSGNPNGRPKRDWTFAGEIEKALEEATKDGKTIKHHLVRSLLKAGLSGNVIAIEKIMNRLDGMPQQKVEMDARGDWNITLKRDEK